MRTLESLARIELGAQGGPRSIPRAPAYGLQKPRKGHGCPLELFLVGSRPRSVG